MIDKDNKVLFIHVPKSGGTSIESYFHNNLNIVTTTKEKHYTLKDYKKEYDLEFKDYYSFLIIRDPWDSMVSLYLYLKKPGFGFDIPEDFNDFVQNFNLSKFRKELSKKGWDQATADLIEFGQIKWYDKDVDKICKFEIYEKEMEIVSENIGVDLCKLKKKNVSKRTRRYRSYYDETSKRIVRKRNVKIINIFDYRF